MASRYVPEAGDIVWLDFDPRVGQEQAGHRPALVLSPAVYNGRTGRLVCRPITIKIKGFPFEEALAGKPPSVALSDAVKAVDWRTRGAKRTGRATATELEEVRSKLGALIGVSFS